MSSRAGRLSESASESWANRANGQTGKTGKRAKRANTEWPFVQVLIAGGEGFVT
jgi:hypothetical protein